MGACFGVPKTRPPPLCSTNDDKAGCVAQQKHHCTSNRRRNPNRRHARHAAADVPVMRARRNPGRRAHTAPARRSARRAGVDQLASWQLAGLAEVNRLEVAHSG